MNSKFFLTFRNPQDQIDYDKARNPEIIFISSLLLIERIIFLLILVITYLTTDDVITDKRLIL